MTNGEVDRPGALAMQAWLRETARNTRSKRDSPYLSQAEINLAPHVAFRLEQAADMLGELEGMRLVRRALEPSADARDAARYRYLRDDHAYEPEEQAVRGGSDLDDLCDAGNAENRT